MMKRNLLLVVSQVVFVAYTAAAQSEKPWGYLGIPSIAAEPRAGRLWVTYYGGETPGEDSNNLVFLKTSVDGGRTWTEAARHDPDGKGPRRAYDPQVFVPDDGTLRWTWTELVAPSRGTPPPVGLEAPVFWTGGLDVFAGRRTNDLMMMTFPSASDVSTSVPSPRVIEHGVMMGKPVCETTARWLLPLADWGRSPSSVIVLTEDGGRTFRRLGGFTSPQPGRSFDETAVVRLRDGSLQMWARHDNGPKTAVSTDGGQTWSAPVAATFENASTRFALRRLKSGSLLLIKNGRVVDRRDGRRNLSVFLSDDDGRTWRGGALLDERVGATYPDFDQLPDGTIVACWDYDRNGAQEIPIARFTEADVLAGGVIRPVGNAGAEKDAGEELQRRIDAAPGGVVEIDAGLYELTRPLVITNGCSLKMHKNAKVRASRPMDVMIRIDLSCSRGRDLGVFYSGGDIDGNGLASCLTIDGFHHPTMRDMVFRNGKVFGLHVGGARKGGCELIADNLYFLCDRRGLAGNTAIKLDISDCHFTDNVIVDWTVGIDVVSGGANRFTRCHVWGGSIRPKTKGGQCFSVALTTTITSGRILTA